MEEEIKNVMDDNNEFAGVDEDLPPTQEDVQNDNSSMEEELTPESFARESYIQNPEVGESILLEVKKVISNKQTQGVNKDTGEKFVIGVERKDGKVIRNDIVTPNGRYTVKNWEIFYKLFGSDGIVSNYAKEKNTFEGLKVKITKVYNGAHAMRDVKELAKLTDKTEEDAKVYKEEVAKALKEKKLYLVEKVD